MHFWLNYIQNPSTGRTELTCIWPFWLSYNKKLLISIENTLSKTDGYKWDNDKLLLNIIARACKIKNDVVKVRFPIHMGLLEQILFEIERIFGETQPYLNSLYKAIFCMGYYGLMRIGELVDSPHVLRAKDLFIASNKNKLLIVLYSSKTHDQESHPQKIKITEKESDCSNLGQKKFKTPFFCPFREIRKYMAYRGEEYLMDDKPFFVLTDRSPVTQPMLRNLLRKILKRLNLNWRLYTIHSLRLGRGGDLLKQGMGIEMIKQIGRWKSNAVLQVLKTNVLIQLKFDNLSNCRQHPGL